MAGQRFGHGADVGSDSERCGRSTTRDDGLSYRTRCTATPTDDICDRCYGGRGGRLPIPCLADRLGAQWFDISGALGSVDGADVASVLGIVL